MRRVITILLAALPVLGAHAATGAAPTNVYDVEVVVFENRQPDLEGGELWTWSKKPAPSPGDAIAPPAPAVGNSELAAAVAALQNDPRYRVLVYQRWAQSAETKAATKPVLVRGGDGEVDGALLFYVNRFLHVEVALGFQPPRAALGAVPAPDANGALYRINEQRRIKSQETHYFDHPKFGALVRITPAAAGALAATPPTDP